jgi:RecB family exonuclease
LNKYWIKDGYADAEEEERFKVRANMFLEEYFKSLTGEENPVMFEVSARWNWNDIDTVVQIDRVDKLPDGKLEVIDYKTGKKVPDERVINEDTTLINMFLAANQKWPGQIAKVSYHYLSNNKRYSLTPSNEDIKAHKIKINELVKQIEKNEFESNKGALCAWCEFYGPCPEWKVKPHEMVGETQEEFRKRIRLSYSKMSLYLNCPRSYRKLYIDKVPPKPQPFFSFGTTIHETFERVYDPLNPIPKPSLEEILEIYDEVRLTHREGFASDEIEQQYREDGIKQITMYYHRFIKNCEFKPAFSIEDYFEIPCGKYAVMTGFIDRIDKLDDGTYEILDYKTEPTMRSQEAVDNDKQLSIYYWACEDTLGLKISKLSLLMLDHDCKIETTRVRDDIPKVIESVDKTAYAMINETEFKPRKNKYCKSCDHLHDCPLKDEILKDDSLISMKKF